MAMASDSYNDVESMDDSFELQALWPVGTQNDTADHNVAPASPLNSTTDYNVAQRDLINLATRDLIDLATPEPGQAPAPGTPGIPETPPSSPIPREDPVFDVELTPRTSTPIGTPPVVNHSIDLEDSDDSDDSRSMPNALLNAHSFSHAPPGVFLPPGVGFYEEPLSPHGSSLSSSHRSTATLGDASGPSYDYPPANQAIFDYSIDTQHAFFHPLTLEVTMLRSPLGLHGSGQWQPDDEGRYAPDYDTASWMTLLTTENGYARQVLDEDWAKALAFSMLGLERKLRQGCTIGSLVLEPSLTSLVPRDRPLMIQGPNLASRGCIACPKCWLWYTIDAGGAPITMIWHSAPAPNEVSPTVADKSRYGVTCLNEACQSPHVCLTRLHPLLDDGYFPEGFLDQEYANAFESRFNYQELSRLQLQSPLVPPAEGTFALPTAPSRLNALREVWKLVTALINPPALIESRSYSLDSFMRVPHESRWAPAENGRAVLSAESMRHLPLAIQVPLAPDAPQCEYGCPNCLWVWGVAVNNQRTHVFAWCPVCPLPDSFAPPQYADLAVFVTHQCPNSRCTRPHHPVLLHGPGEEAYLRCPPSTRQYRQQAYFDLCCNPGRLICNGDERRHGHPYSLSH